MIHKPCGLTSRRSQPPLALAVPLSRFTSQVGGGSAFYVRHLMKWKPFKIPFTIRVVVFIFGAVSVSSPIRAIYSGKFPGKPWEISAAREPLAFWALIVIYLLLSAGLFYVAFTKRLPDA